MEKLESQLKGVRNHFETLMNAFETPNKSSKINILILGLPGAGKSSLINYIYHCLSPYEDWNSSLAIATDSNVSTTLNLSRKNLGDIPGLPAITLMDVMGLSAFPTTTWRQQLVEHLIDGEIRDGASMISENYADCLQPQDIKDRVDVIVVLVDSGKIKLNNNGKEEYMMQEEGEEDIHLAFIRKVHEIAMKKDVMYYILLTKPDTINTEKLESWVKVLQKIGNENYFTFEMDTGTHQIGSVHERLASRIKLFKLLHALFAGGAKRIRERYALIEQMNKIVPPAPSSCVLPGSLILMANREWRAIEQLRIGDRILDASLCHQTVIGCGKSFLQERHLYGFTTTGPFFTGEHQFVSSHKARVCVSPILLFQENPQMKEENVLPFEFHSEILSYQTDRDLILPTNVTLVEYPYDPFFFPSDSPVYYLQVSGSSGTYICEGYAMYQDLPQFNKWPFTSLAILWVLHKLSLNRTLCFDIQNLTQYKEMESFAIEICSSWEPLLRTSTFNSESGASQQEINDPELLEFVKSFSSDVNESASQFITKLFASGNNLCQVGMWCYSRSGERLHEVLDNSGISLPLQIKIIHELAESAIRIQKRSQSTN